MNPSSVTVVRITSLSYTGTTWINLLLGCHERGFVLGPPDRVLDLLHDEPGKGAEACRIHADECPFWSGFFSSYDPDANFYIQLARASARDVIVINNATPGSRADQHLQHPDVIVRDVVVARDGRATLASYLRIYPESDPIDVLKDWFLPSASNLPFDRDDPDRLCVNYEHVVADQLDFIDRAGKFIGLEYPDGCHRFWEFDHHPVAGNAGVLGVVRRHQGRSFTGRYAEGGEANYQRLLHEPDRPLYDERWKAELGTRERLAFDSIAGDVNERWGYPRDRFTAAEMRSFESDLESDPEVRALAERRAVGAEAATVEIVDPPRSPARRRRIIATLLAAYVISIIAVAILSAVIF